jgi:hypothetical protein
VRPPASQRATTVAVRRSWSKSLVRRRGVSAAPLNRVTVQPVSVLGASTCNGPAARPPRVQVGAAVQGEAQVGDYRGGMPLVHSQSRQFAGPGAPAQRGLAPSAHNSSRREPRPHPQHAWWVACGRCSKVLPCVVPRVCSPIPGLWRHWTVVLTGAFSPFSGWLTLYNSGLRAARCGTANEQTWKYRPVAARIQMFARGQCCRPAWIARRTGRREPLSYPGTAGTADAPRRQPVHGQEPEAVWSGQSQLGTDTLSYARGVRWSPPWATRYTRAPMRLLPALPIRLRCTTHLSTKMRRGQVGAGRYICRPEVCAPCDTATKGPASSSQPKGRTPRWLTTGPTRAGNRRARGLGRASRPHRHGRFPVTVKRPRFSAVP